MADTAIVPADLGSIEHDPINKGFHLVNDEDSPGANKVYGTNAAATKGFHDPVIIPPGPYDDDAAAATAGVAVGHAYRISQGNAYGIPSPSGRTVVVRIA